jgi:hypothetical protein
VVGCGGVDCVSAGRMLVGRGERGGSLGGLFTLGDYCMRDSRMCDDVLDSPNMQIAVTYATKTIPTILRP